MPDRYTNPILWQDLPDPEVIRVGDVYYMSTSNFHFSPGAPIHKSFNLVDWAPVGHSIPRLPPDSRFSLDGKKPTAYGKGVWASTLRYRESNKLFYFYSPIQGTDATYVYTAENPSDTWTAHPPIPRFYYDLGLLVDDDDTLYIAHGTKTIEVAQMSPDGLSEVCNKPVYTSDEYMEGARMYKIAGMYYIWVTSPGPGKYGQYMLRSSEGPFGPYEARKTIMEMEPPLQSCGCPHQGALVDTPSGQWHYMAFIDAYPAGRVPVLAPMITDEDGWPRVQADYSRAKTGQWLLNVDHPLPNERLIGNNSCSKRHTFTDSPLEHCWEWNHNPDDSRWAVSEKRLVLQTGTVTDSLHLATNTLTHRTIGPGSIATISIHMSKMTDGDRTGISLFRDESVYIGVHKSAGRSNLVFLDRAKVGPSHIPVGFQNGRPAALDWKLVSEGVTRAEVPLKHDRVWLRIQADLRPRLKNLDEDGTSTRKATFEYSYDGTLFERLGPEHTLTNSRAGYVGHRFGIFNFATEALGGEISVDYLDLETWDPQGR